VRKRRGVNKKHAGKGETKQEECRSRTRVQQAAQTGHVIMHGVIAIAHELLEEQYAGTGMNSNKSR